MRIEEAEFRFVLESQLDGFWDRALVVFRNYHSKNLEQKVVNLIIEAVERKKVDVVLKMMEVYYDTYLMPNGKTPSPGVDELEKVLLIIRTQVLCLPPNSYI